MNFGGHNSVHNRWENAGYLTRSFLYICSDKSLVPATADSLSWKEPGMQAEVKVPPGTLRGKGMLLLPGSASDTPDNNSSEERWWVASVLGQPAFVSDPW